MKVALSLLLLATGCAEPPTPPVRLTTEHFVIHSDSEVCAGLGEWYERTYEAWSTFLGVTLPSHRKIKIVQYAERIYVECVCGGPPATGCTDGNTVWSLSTYDQHEVAHVLAGRLGRPPAVFEEGLAVALGCSQYLGGHTIERPADITEWIVNDAFEEGSRAEVFARYEPSADFVSYVLARFGREAFLALYAALPHSPSREELRAVFSSTMGTELDEVVAGWVSSPSRSMRDICSPLTECSSEPLPRSATIQLSCGPRSVTRDVETAQDVRTLEVVEGGPTVHLELNAPSTFEATVHGCGMEVATLQLVGQAGQSVALLGELPTGSYRVWLATPDSSGEVLVNQTMADGLLGSSCLEARELLVGPSLGELLVVIARGGGPRWLRLRPTVDRQLLLQYHGSSSADLEVSRISLCTSTCGSDCTVTRPADSPGGLAGTTLLAGMDYFVELAPSDGSGVSRMSLLFVPAD